MTATIFSLLAVTVGFVGLVAWVYWPSRRSELESLGQIPLEDDPVKSLEHDSISRPENTHE